jgi:hypothetical protein
MGQLDRYKKPGGFQQLLALIESFAAQKQEKFLNIVDQENPTWGKALREKLLTVKRILNWPPATLAEIVPTMNVNILAIALHGLTKEEVERFLSGLPAGEKRKITNEFEVVRPQPNEIVATHVRLIDTVRKMINEGQLRLESVDPGVLITEKTEEQLLQASTFVRGESDDADAGTEAAATEKTMELVTAAVSQAGGARPDNAKLVAEIKSLQALMVSIQKENKSLKTEVKLLKDKLDAIRKIA